MSSFMLQRMQVETSTKHFELSDLSEDRNLTKAIGS